MALFNRRRRDDDEQASGGTVAGMATEDDSLSMIEALFASPVASSALPSMVPPAEPARRAAAHVAVESGVGVPVFSDGMSHTRAESDQDADPVPLESDPALPENHGRRSSGRLGTEEERARMANLEQSVQDLLSIDGATGAAIVDSGSGMALAEGGHPGFDLGIAAAGNSNVVRAKLQTMRDLGLTATIDDILITLDQQYHLINVLHSAGNEGLFVYLVLDRNRSNLALARHKLTQVAGQIQI